MNLLKIIQVFVETMVGADENGVSVNFVFGMPEAETTAATARTPTAAVEAEGALIALGYKPTEVAKMLQPFDAASMTTEALIREALRRVHAH